MQEAPPGRLYGILARKAAVAVLFRRGPTKQVQLIRWDTATDRFEPGQWLKGRIYERRSDLSPDGRLLVYLAASWKASLGPQAGSWTAVSRPPYFTALARWTKGDAWSGGGLFQDDGHLGLNNGGGAHVPAEPMVTPFPLEVSDLNLGRGEDDPIEITRDLRDGWVLLQDMQVTAPKMPSTPPPTMDFGEQGENITRDFIDEMSKWIEENPIGSGYVTHAPRILEKRTGAGLLRREESLVGYRVIRKYSVAGFNVDLSGAEWVEWDQRGRLVFARGGGLFAAHPEVVPLADFNANRFAPLEAPAWAREWPR